MARAQAGPADPDAYAALEEQRDFLLASLDDLEQERAAGDLDEADYEALRDDYTARAAAVLRALDEGGARYAATRRPGSLRYAAAVMAAVLVFGAGAGLLVARTSGTRSGNPSASGDPRLDTRDDLARALTLFSEGQVLESVMLYDEILADDPDNVEALTYRGWALIQSTLVEDGLEYLQRAVDVDPTYPDARIFRAITFKNQGRLDEARTELAVVDQGQIPVAMEPLIESLRRDLALGAGSPASTAPAGVVSAP